MITAKDLYLTYDSNKYIIKRGNFSIKKRRSLSLLEEIQEVENQHF